jgi:hypothetical protein
LRQCELGKPLKMGIPHVKHHQCTCGNRGESLRPMIWFAGGGVCLKPRRWNSATVRKAEECTHSMSFALISAGGGGVVVCIRRAR